MAQWRRVHCSLAEVAGFQQASVPLNLLSKYIKIPLQKVIRITSCNFLLVGYTWL